MIKLDSITLFLSWKCNFSCAHCGFQCNPARKEKMSFQEAKRHIDTVTENQDLKMLAFSGGEPFLYYNEVKELMSYARQKKLVGGIVSNCFWAVDYNTAYETLQELKNLGLREIITSFDDFHSEYVSAQNISYVIKAASQLGIKTGLNILATKKSRIRKSNASSILGLDLKDLACAQKLWVRESSPLIVGRAKESLNKEEFSPRNLITYGGKELLYNPCPYVIRNSIITPEGAFYACCGFGDATSLGPSSLTYGGNMEKSSFPELFTGVSHNLMLNIICLYGPYLLVKLAKDLHPDLVIKERYVSNCEVCGEIATNKELYNAVGEVLNRIALQSKGVK